MMIKAGPKAKNWHLWKQRMLRFCSWVSWEFWLVRVLACARSLLGICTSAEIVAEWGT